MAPTRSLYRQLADDFAASIRDGTLKAGERVPSVRELSRDRGLSPSTVVHAYELLEADGFIETRPRSGFYVSAVWQAAPRAAAPRSTSRRGEPRTTRVDVSELVFQVLESVRDRDVVPLGSAFPSPMLFPLARLGRCLSAGARQMDPWSTLDDLPPGSPELRSQIARRYLRSGSRTLPGQGADIGAFARILDRHPVRACWLMTNRHLAGLRRALAAQQAAALGSLSRHLPPGFRVIRPEGGYFLWVELAPGHDAIAIHEQALEQGFSVAPGPIFSPRRQFRGRLRLNYGHEWSPAFEAAVRKLGNILRTTARATA